MELQPLMSQLPELERQLKDADERATRFVRDAQVAAARASKAVQERDGLQRVIEGLKALQAIPPDQPDSPGLKWIRHGTHKKNFPQPIAGADAATPRGREAVRRVLREKGRWMQPREIISEIVGRGWIDPDAKNPDSSVRIATRRLLDDGEVERRQGMYRYKLSSGTPDDSAEPADGQGALLAEEGGDQ